MHSITQTQNLSRTHNKTNQDEEGLSQIENSPKGSTNKSKCPRQCILVWPSYTNTNCSSLHCVCGFVCVCVCIRHRKSHNFSLDTIYDRTAVVATQQQQQAHCSPLLYSFADISLWNHLLSLFLFQLLYFCTFLLGVLGGGQEKELLPIATIVLLLFSFFSSNEIPESNTSPLIVGLKLFQKFK